MARRSPSASGGAETNTTPILVGVASRPFPGERLNGDIATVSWHGDVCRLVVIDGLGHGPEAARSAERAQQLCEELPDLPPARVLEACHYALEGLRGAAISVARIDATVAHLTFAGVGNVEARLLQAGQETRFSPDRGIAGVRLPRIVPLDIELVPAWTLAVYTDGVDGRFELAGTLGGTATEPAQLADALLQQCARPTDDATLAIAWCRAV